MSLFRGWRLALLGATIFVLVPLLLMRWLDPIPEGLVATYYSNASWSSDPVHAAIDARPSTDSFIDAWHGTPPDEFSATWTGSFIVLRPGAYSFATISDDGSWVYIDGQLVVDNGGNHEARRAVGSIPLERGVHSIFVRYFQAGGDLDFELLWARNSAPLAPIPSWILSTRRAEFARLLVSAFARLALRAALWIWWLLALALAIVSVWRRTANIRRAGMADPLIRALALVIAGSMLLNLAGIAWGLPAVWAGDELTPTAVVFGLSHRFTGGWFDRYPPLHFYVLSVAFAPWFLMKWLGMIQAMYRTQDIVLPLLGRLVSIAAAAGTLIAVYASGARAFGRRAGVLAAAALAVVAPFVYYAKTANPEIPYVFWFAVSLVFFVRLLDRFSTGDAALFGASAVFAICTKDQAYALYLLAPVAIVYHLWRCHRTFHVSHPFWRAALDRRLIIGAAIACALFVAIHNILFNAHGFWSHVRDITGPGSQPYRMFDSTFDGRLGLFRLALDLDRRSWGWPLWLISLCGAGVAMTESRSRRFAVGFACIVLGYYAGFIDVIMYAYDRYLLPICVVQALFAGVALDRLLRRSQRAADWWRTLLVAGTFAYTLLYTATVDVLMIRDSRYTAEAWLRARDAGQIVGTAFPVTVIPRLDWHHSAGLGSIDDLREIKPAFFVLNADYARAVPTDSRLGQLICGIEQGTLGYRLAMRYRTPSPWPWLPGGHPDLVGPRRDAQVYSTLRDVNPTIEIYERIAANRSDDQ